VPRDEFVRRLRHRREVEARADAAEEAIVHRLATYDAQAGAIRRAMEGWADVAEIDGARPTAAVTEEILRRVGQPARSRRS
jgi:adenylate kinase family enzyme